MRTPHRLDPIRFPFVTGTRRTLLRLLTAATLGHAGWFSPAAAHDALPRCKKIDDKKKRKKCLKRAKRHNKVHTTPRVFEFRGEPQEYTVPAKGTLTVE